MKTLRYFFKLYTGILTTPLAYIRFLKFSNIQLLGFMLLSSLLLSSIWSTKVINHELRSFKENSQQAAHEFIDYYPDTLVATWDKRQILLNPSQNYSIYYPSYFDPKQMELPYRIADIIPNQTDQIQLANSHLDALVVISPYSLYIQQSDNDWQEFSLQELLTTSNFTISKDFVSHWIQQGPLFDSQFWQQLQLVLILVAPLFVFSGLTWNTTIFTLLAYLIAVKLYNAPISGKQLIKISVPIVVTTTFVQLVAELLYGNVTIPLMSIAYWILLLLVLRRISLRKVIRIHKTKKTKK